MGGETALNPRNRQLLTFYIVWDKYDTICEMAVRKHTLDDHSLPTHMWQPYNLLGSRKGKNLTNHSHSR